MSITPEYLDELRQRLPASEVVSRQVVLQRRGREHVGLCPFHKEKTPSFTVNDEKGFFHCFGCGAHGDIVRFVMETEGLSFPETVERLAANAGMDPPPRGPHDEEKAEKRASLYDAMEAAASWFRSQLASNAGRQAADYIQSRGLTAETAAEFRLGFAPDRRSALKEAMLARGLPEPLLVEAGLLIRPEDGGESYDRFRGRVIFPIDDARGRAVAFGGRALGEATAKYLNSPETPLFHKGRLLYNLSRARRHAHEAGLIVAVEGYMDVIALAQAGIGHAVAPLGTALTEDQLHLLWRLAPEPILCFDGDDAGLRAAHRAIERALPLLAPGLSLRFAFLPKGEDPDSLVRGHGAAAMTELLNAAEPLVETLWRERFRDASADTPERRAGLERQIADLCSGISDDKVRSHYLSDLKNRLWRRFSETRGGRDFRQGGPRRASGRSVFKGSGPAPRASSELIGQAMAAEPRREQLLLLAVINHPAILDLHAEAFAAAEFTSAELDKMRAELLGIAARFSPLDSGEVRRHFQQQGLAGQIAWLERQLAGHPAWYVSPDAALEDVVTGWTLELKRHRREVSLRAELAKAEAEFAREGTDEAYERFLAVKAEVDAAEGDEAIVEGYGVASGREPAV